MMKMKTALHQSFSLTISAQGNHMNVMNDLLSDHYDFIMDETPCAWTIDFDDLNNSPYHLDIDETRITLHNFGLKTDHLLASPYFRPQVVLALVEAMRMARHMEWLDGSWGDYNPETLLMIGRLCEADVQTHKILVAWNAKIEDDNHVLWKHILCGDQSSMAVAFITAMETLMSKGMDEDIALKKSMAVAFNSWFGDVDIVRACDHDTLNMLDDMVMSNHQFGTKKLQRNLLTCLTIMGNENTTYLDRFLQDDILKNPYYSALNDEINQSHLMQIMMDMNTISVGGIKFHDPALAARFALID